MVIILANLKAKVLIIDDEIDMRNSIAALLKSKGVDMADTAATPEMGIKKAKAQDYDVIILDMIMPRISGWGVLKEIKGAKLKTRVLVVSAVGLPEMVATEIKAKYPTVEFLSKTNLALDLEGKVKEIMKKPAGII